MTASCCNILVGLGERDLIKIHPTKSKYISTHHFWPSLNQRIDNTAKYPALAMESDNRIAPRIF